MVRVWIWACFARRSVSCRGVRERAGHRGGPRSYEHKADVTERQYQGKGLPGECCGRSLLDSSRTAGACAAAFASAKQRRVSWRRWLDFLSVVEKRKRCLVAKSGWKICVQGCGRRVEVFLRVVDMCAAGVVCFEVSNQILQLTVFLLKKIVTFVANERKSKIRQSQASGGSHRGI